MGTVRLPKILVLTIDDSVPAQPTFNTNSLEPWLWRIPGLSPTFVHGQEKKATAF